MHQPLQDGDASVDMSMPIRATRSGVAAVICSTIGCVAWLILVPFLDSCEQGEQLARFFAVLFNQILIGVVGGPATILLIVGLVLSRRSARLGSPQLAKIANAASYIGLTIGVLVLLLCLPASLSTLH
jgi:hypothetical protein